MTNDDLCQHIDYDLEILSMVLRPKRWHGRGIIFNGPFVATHTTIREMFDDLRRHIVSLQQLAGCAAPSNTTSSRPPELAGLWDYAENRKITVNPAAADD
jgi:hypothetical protein